MSTCVAVPSTHQRVLISGVGAKYGWGIGVHDFLIGYPGTTSQYPSRSRPTAWQVLDLLAKKVQYLLAK
ncbi:hypothetical protein PCANC_12371 [Puccinia coronata f. sp. avenae]|uniref:Uncharacterized protein n=1 Tax=Puccinia coronata f. sp. avenae TaxID=200324 RepID=A0A2N5UTQ9_9BASI|nr:hypothetical protein PCANC_12371 [Puccinia coronata f. sp. avenae]